MPKEFYNCILHQEALTALALTPMHILESAVSGKPVPHWPDSPWKSATITDLCQPYCRKDPAPAYKESDHISGPVVTSLSQRWWCQAGKRLLWVWLCFNSPLSSARGLWTQSSDFGHRSFSHAASSVWNFLPREIRHIQSTTAFRIALKTHLFKSYLY